MFRFLSQTTENEELTLKAQTGNTEKRELMAPSSRVIKIERKTPGSTIIPEKQLILKANRKEETEQSDEKVFSNVKMYPQFTHKNLLPVPLKLPFQRHRIFP